MAGAAEADALGVGARVGVGEAEAVPEARGLGEADALDVPLAEAVGDGAEEPDADTRGDDDGCGAAEVVAVVVGAAVGVGEDGEEGGLAVGDGETVGDSARAVVPSASDAAIKTQVAAVRMKRVGPTRSDTGGSRLRHAPSRA